MDRRTHRQICFLPMFFLRACLHFGIFVQSLFLPCIMTALFSFHNYNSLHASGPSLSHRGLFAWLCDISFCIYNSIKGRGAESQSLCDTLIIALWMSFFSQRQSGWVPKQQHYSHNVTEIFFYLKTTFASSRRSSGPKRTHIRANTDTQTFLKSILQIFFFFHSE